jgi:hypothetical protein
MFMRAGVPSMCWHEVEGAPAAGWREHPICAAAVAFALLGLIRHMADVERHWFRRVMAQSGAPPLYWSEDVPDADWLGAVADPALVDDAWRAWRGEVAFAEKFVADSPTWALRAWSRTAAARRCARCWST